MWLFILVFPLLDSCGHVEGAVRDADLDKRHSATFVSSFDCPIWSNGTNGLNY
jgi:hypothetical protein